MLDFQDRTRDHIDKLRIVRYIGYISAIIIVVFIPTYVWFIPPFMIIWGLTAIIEIMAQRSKGIFIHNQYAIIVFVLFLIFCFWQLIGIIYSPDKSTGFRFFFSRLSLLLFPAVMVEPGIKIKENINRLLKIFSLSTTLYVLFCFFFAFFRSISFVNNHMLFNPHPPEEPWTSYFYGYFFSYNQHASYLSLYVVISSFIALENCFTKNIRKIFRISWLIIFFLLISSVYFLSSRTGIILLIILIPLYFLFRFRKSLNLVSIIVSLIVAIFASILILLSNWKTREVFDGVISGNFNQTINRDGRLVIWEAAMNPIKKHLILGVGTGGVDTVMREEYKRIGNEKFLNERYNLHSQYLEVLLENGLIGLLIFMAMISAMVFTAFSQKNLLYGIYILTIMFFFLFETGLNRLPGVSFFSLFSLLLIFYSDKERISRTSVINSH